jgi:hypothetical protein
MVQGVAGGKTGRSLTKKYSSGHKDTRKNFGKLTGLQANAMKRKAAAQNPPPPKGPTSSSGTAIAAGLAIPPILDSGSGGGSNTPPKLNNPTGLVKTAVTNQGAVKNPTKMTAGEFMKSYKKTAKYRRGEIRYVRDDSGKVVFREGFHDSYTDKVRSGDVPSAPKMTKEEQQIHDTLGAIPTPKGIWEYRGVSKIDKGPKLDNIFRKKFGLNYYQRTSMSSENAQERGFVISTMAYPANAEAINHVVIHDESVNNRRLAFTKLDPSQSKGIYEQIASSDSDKGMRLLAVNALNPKDDRLALENIASNNNMKDIQLVAVSKLDSTQSKATLEKIRDTDPDQDLKVAARKKLGK